MINNIRQLWALMRLAIALKRHGGLQALGDIPIFPSFLYRFLWIITLLIPTRLKTAPTLGERLAAALATMGPAYIKVGQTMATRPDVVGKPIAEGLATLQDRLPPFAYRDVVDIFRAEHGKTISELFAEFDKTPIAAASISQVHRATTHDGVRLAVKILRPNVRRRFASDIRLFDWLAGLAERYLVEARRLKLGEIVDKIRETTAAEMDFRIEAAAAEELADNMRGEPGYMVPDVIWPLTSERILALQWIDGIPLNRRDDLIAADHDLGTLATRIVSIFLRQALHDGYFHADLHQGNLLITPDGTIAAVDFGIMGRLAPNERRYLAEILYGFVRKDYIRVADVHFEAGYVPMSEDRDAFAQALKSIADPIIDLPVDQISAAKLLGQLFATTERFSMQTRPELLLLQRSMVMAEGLALHLNPASNLWQTARPVLEDWLRDHMSPEVALADLIRRLPALASRAPEILDRLIAPPHATAEPCVREIVSTSVNPHPIWPFIAGAALATSVLSLI